MSISKFRNSRFSLKIWEINLKNFGTVYQCNGNYTQPPARPSRCYLNSGKVNPGWAALEVIRNAEGEPRTIGEGESGIDFLLRTIESGFCQLDEATLCTERYYFGEYFVNCKPSITTFTELFVGDSRVFSGIEPSVCNFSSDNGDSSSYGDPNYKFELENAKRRLESLCRVVSRHLPNKGK